MFKPLKGTYAILQTNGVYTVAPLHEFGGVVYAEFKPKQFLKLKIDKSTSKQKIRWQNCSLKHFEFNFNSTGIMTVAS